jgi:hypothetical protein
VRRAENERVPMPWNLRRPRTAGDVFGDLVGAFHGDATCPDHFSTTNQFRYIVLHALIGMAVRWVGSLIHGRIAKPE